MSTRINVAARRTFQAGCAALLAFCAWTARPARAEEPGKPGKAAEEKPKCKPGMIFVPAGTFTMGDDLNKDKAGQVKVAAFCMDQTEVTASAYEACTTAGRCKPTTTMSSVCNTMAPDRKSHPVNCVDWHQATAFCKAKGLRLPTEEEWEYGARGADGRLFSWGNEPPKDQLCWDGEGSDLGKHKRHFTCAAGAFSKDTSPFGLLDMSGNVTEWVSTANGADRVMRGGNWSSDKAADLRAASRGWVDPKEAFEFAGFRCAGSPLR